MAASDSDLQCLEDTDQLVILRYADDNTDADSPYSDQDSNFYKVLNSTGQPVLWAQEQSHSLIRLCCGALRSSNILVVDSRAQPVVMLERPLFRWSDSINVLSAQGHLIGCVVQRWTVVRTAFDLLDSGGGCQLRAVGPSCPLLCSGPRLKFAVFSGDGGCKVGSVVKATSHVSKGKFIGVDEVSAEFPMDMDEKAKALLLALALLIDINYSDMDGW